MTPAEPMTPADMEGMVIGPVSHHADAERIGAFVAATCDDVDRWTDAAPPGYAAVLLFAVAGEFLWDSRIAAHRRTLIHVDQQFTYPKLLPTGAEVTITGTVGRVRQRSGAFFVTFLADAEVDGDTVVASKSTFLMSDEAAGTPGADESEPAATERAENDVVRRRELPAAGDLASLTKSASRADLVRYAAASADFNPLHWDHGSARAAGLDGVVVHGLLMHAWLAQYAASYGAGEAPVATIKTRFKNALRPGAPTTVSGWLRTVADDGRSADLGLSLAGAATEYVTATATVRV